MSYIMRLSFCFKSYIYWQNLFVDILCFCCAVLFAVWSNWLLFFACILHPVLLASFFVYGAVYLQFMRWLQSRTGGSCTCNQRRDSARCVTKSSARWRNVRLFTKYTIVSIFIFCVLCVVRTELFEIFWMGAYLYKYFVAVWNGIWSCKRLCSYINPWLNITFFYNLSGISPPIF